MDIEMKLDSVGGVTDYCVINLKEHCGTGNYSFLPQINAFVCQNHFLTWFTYVVNIDSHILRINTEWYVSTYSLHNPSVSLISPT